MVGLGKEEPALGDQANVLGNECCGQGRTITALHSLPEQYRGHQEYQHDETILDGFHESPAGMVEKVPRIDRATHHAHGFLLNILVANTNCRLDTGLGFQMGIANQ